MFDHKLNLCAVKSLLSAVGYSMVDSSQSELPVIPTILSFHQKLEFFNRKKTNTREHIWALACALFWTATRGPAALCPQDYTLSRIMERNLGEILFHD